MTDSQSDGSLKRTLGLFPTLAVGVGTMVGAGIFVFPGIAVGRAGAAATVSFLLAGLISLLIALPTAELATALPASGGGYHFVSRSFGRLPGTLVGVAQWAGLVFASAFYLVGFGRYVGEVASEIGLDARPGAVPVAFGAAVALGVLNLLTTRGTGRLQSYVVVALTVILGGVFAYGAVWALGIEGQTHLPTAFAPEGWTPVLSTTALIYTSYLGFVQIATVAGDVVRPRRNLPRAILGSVALVTLLYVLALFVSSATLPRDELASLGETAVVEVVRRLTGDWGARAVLFAGLLATLSSANASILSGSRAVFALSRDGVVPVRVSAINERFGTPHVALLCVAVPVAALTWLGRVEVLAQTASVLHLVIYAGICAALFRYRRSERKPAPFRSPGHPVVAGAGLACAGGLIALAEPAALGMGGAVLAVALVWHVGYRLRRKGGDTNEA